MKTEKNWLCYWLESFFLCLFSALCLYPQALGGFQSLITTHTHKHAQKCTFCPACLGKKNVKKVRWGNWLVMWGNSNPIIPNNSLPQHTSSSLIPQNPPQLIPDRLADILSFIYQPPAFHLFILCTRFMFGWSVLLNIGKIILKLFPQMSSYTRFECMCMCESMCVCVLSKALSEYMCVPVTSQNQLKARNAVKHHSGVITLLCILNVFSQGF